MKRMIYASEFQDAAKAYTAQGGQYQSKYPLGPQARILLKRHADNNTFVTDVDLYRKVDLSERDYNNLFNQLYNDDSITISFDKLTSFTKDRLRAQTFGGTAMQYVIYKIPAGTKIHGVDISEESLYPEEQEVLLGSNSFIAYYNELDWVRTNMLITLHNI